MKGGGESWVRELWRGGHGPGGAVVRTALLPAEWAFRAGVALRNRRFDREGGTRGALPVVSVGNLSVGGTGKTPIASWALSVLASAGVVPALVARGYGADELALHRMWTPEAIVVADPDRVAGVEAAASAGAAAVVLDDGFQHRRLSRELDIVLVAAEQGLPGALLPRGPFREGRGALRRAGVVVVTRKTASEPEAADLGLRAAACAPTAVRARVRFETRDHIGLDGRPVEAPNGPVRVLTSVADPEGVAEGVELRGGRVDDLHGFPDHHDFRDADVESALAGWRGPVVVTEKDAVKLRTLTAARSMDVRVVRQKVVFEEGEAELRAAILRAVGRTDGEVS